MGSPCLRQGHVGLILSRILSETPACTHVAPAASPSVWCKVLSFFLPHVLSRTEASRLHSTAQQ